MSVIEDIKKTTPRPVYAFLGVQDLWLEKVREAGDKAADVATEYRFANLSTKADEVGVKLEGMPKAAREFAQDLRERMTSEYDVLASRGEKFADRILGQQVAKDLAAQAGQAETAVKDAVATARKSFADVERSAKGTVTTARKEAAHLGKVITDTVTEDAEKLQTEVASSAKKTRTAAKRTTTTARNAATRTTAKAKTAPATARKSATTARKTAVKAADKVTKTTA